MRNYFCQYRYRNLNACKFHLERHVEYSTGPTVDKTNVTLVRSIDFSRAGNTFPWTSASLKISLMESTYPGQRPQSPSLSPHFLLVKANFSCRHTVLCMTSEGNVQSLYNQNDLFILIVVSSHANINILVQDIVRIDSHVANNQIILFHIKCVTSIYINRDRFDINWRREKTF